MLITETDLLNFAARHFDWPLARMSVRWSQAIEDITFYSMLPY